MYRELPDRLFGVSGKWDVRQCDSPDCGMLWLDPTPVDEDLPLLYASYYTHHGSESAKTLLGRWVARMTAAHLHSALGYDSGLPDWMATIGSLMVRLHPMWKSTVEASVFHLHARPCGHLLEVGCGSGSALRSMKEKGWNAVGLDFDEEAVCNARSMGLDVRLGQLSDQGFPEGSFDAIVMGHVIEHVPDPAALLKECKRILKKDGALVMLTPHAGSKIHARYRSDWRGLDVPRHLQVFTPGSLVDMAKRAGFSAIVATTTMNGFVYQDLASTELRAGMPHVMGNPFPIGQLLASHAKGFALGWLHLLSPMTGPELTVVCEK